jgi:diguanylate cyclase (GGDEF)-like protein
VSRPSSITPQSRDRFRILLILATVAIMLMSVLFGELILLNARNRQERNDRERLFVQGVYLAQTIQQAVSGGINVTTNLSMFLQTSNYSPDLFDVWARELYTRNRGIGGIYLAPEGIIRYAYPLEEHRGSIGRDLLSGEEASTGAHIAMDSRSLTFAGPTRLNANDRLSVFAWYPIFSRTMDGSPSLSTNPVLDEFWGFAVSLIYLDDLLPSIFAAEIQGDFDVLITGSNPAGTTASGNGMILFRSPGFSAEDAEITIPISVPNGSWTMYLGSGLRTDINGILYRFVYLMAGGFASMLFAAQRSASWRQRWLIHGLNQRLLEESTHDELTGLLNRRGFAQLFIQMHQLAHRYKDPYCISLVDADYFKQINDTHGHDAGDKVLIALGRLFQEHLRKTDLVCRYGGDEFLIMLPRTDFETGMHLMTNLAHVVRDMKIPDAPEVSGLSISAGLIAGNISEEDVELTDALISCDGKLYEAKEAGRDMVRG